MIFVSAVTMLRCYTLPYTFHVTLHVSHDVTHFRIRCYAVTLLHIAYLKPAVDLYKSFHTVFFVSNVTLLRCYAATHRLDFRRSLESGLCSSPRRYVTHCLPETWLSIYISGFTRSFSYPMLRCYAVTLLHIAYLKPAVDLYKSFHTVFFVSDVTMLRCYAVTMLRCYTLPT